jgi:hypothetical protein
MERIFQGRDPIHQSLQYDRDQYSLVSRTSRFVLVYVAAFATGAMFENMGDYLSQL